MRNSGRSNAIRSIIAKRIIAEGYERLQLSVFVGPGNPKANKPLWVGLNKCLETEPTAKLFAVAITESNFRNMLAIGNNDLDINFLLGNKNTMFV